MGMRDIEREIRNIRKALADMLECAEVEFKPCDWPELREQIRAKLETFDADKLEQLEQRVSALEVLFNA